MKKLMPFLLLAIMSIVLATPVAHALGPPGNSGQVIVGPWYADIGSSNYFKKVAAIYGQARYIDSKENVSLLRLNDAIICAIKHLQHVFRDSASQPATAKSAPNTMNLVNNTTFPAARTPQVIVLNGNSSQATQAITAGGLQPNNAKKQYVNANANFKTILVGAVTTIYLSNVSMNSATGPPKNIDAKNNSAGISQTACDIGAITQPSITGA